MNLSVFLFLAILGLCYGNDSITTTKAWGNIGGENVEIRRISGSPIGHNRTFAYPQFNWHGTRPIIIDGIRLTDTVYPPAKITFLDGGIGASFVTINIFTLRGQPINCSFEFFISTLITENVPMTITDFMETELTISTE